MLAQLSDLHLRPGDPGPEARLERAVAAVAAMDPLPGALLVTGDVADVPAPEVYARARELLEAAGLPLLVVGGNHDDTELLVAAFGAGRLEGRAGPLRVVGVDTSRPGQDGGRVDDRRHRRAWTPSWPRDPATPTVLAMHHPPVLTGVRSLDAIGLPAGRPGAPWPRCWAVTRRCRWWPAATCTAPWRRPWPARRWSSPRASAASCGWTCAREDDLRDRDDHRARRAGGARPGGRRDPVALPGPARCLSGSWTTAR